MGILIIAAKKKFYHQCKSIFKMINATLLELGRLSVLPLKHNRLKLNRRFIDNFLEQLNMP